MHNFNNNVLMINGRNGFLIFKERSVTGLLLRNEVMVKKHPHIVVVAPHVRCSSALNLDHN
jgi:hypothetical protein